MKLWPNVRYGKIYYLKLHISLKQQNTVCTIKYSLFFTEFIPSQKNQTKFHNNDSDNGNKNIMCEQL